MSLTVLTPLTDEEVRENLHPLVLALVGELPTPGTAWPSDKRDAWVNAASGIFDLIYRDEK